MALYGFTLNRSDAKSTTTFMQNTDITWAINSDLQPRPASKKEMVSAIIKFYSHYNQ